MQPKFEFELVTDLRQWTSHSGVWSELAGAMPFRDWPWLSSWWRHYGEPAHELRIVLIREAGSIIGAAPLFREKSSGRGRVLQFLGSGEVCSDYLDLLARPGREPHVVEAMTNWLSAADQTDCQWDLLHLDGICGDDALVLQVAERLAEQGYGVHRRAAQNCWRIALSCDWPSYLGRLSKSHRKQVRRVEQRALESGRTVLKTCAHSGELRHYMNTLVDLHQRRRQQLGQPGCFASTRFTSFLWEVAEQLLTEKQLRLSLLEFDGQAIAAEFGFAADGVLYSYQSGLDPDRLDEEPGRIVTTAAVQQAIHGGMRGFDFLRGDEPYKAHWRAEPTPCFELRIAGKNAAAQLRHNIWLAGDTLKQFVKAQVGR